ncbi:unnamed protein product [Lupinus luteus]|uniref:Methyltransferase n=1 Tax=Lupinus luteus TaxID=3873 RepID=A0AAV1WFQ2_LUPLU
MAKPSSADGRTRSSVQIFIVAGLCCFFYILGAWQRSGFGKGDIIALEITKKGADCNIVPNLSFDSHHGGEFSKIDEVDSKARSRQEDSSVKFCESTDADDVWYKKMEACVTPNSIVSGGNLKPFQQRLYAIPPRIASGSVPGVSAETIQDDNKKWKIHV